MKTNRSFIIEVEGGSAIVGIPESATVTIALGHGKKYSASVEKIHAAMCRWNSGKQTAAKPKRRRLLTHSDQMKGKEN